MVGSTRALAQKRKINQRVSLALALSAGVAVSCGPRTGTSISDTSNLSEVNTSLSALASNTAAIVPVPPDPSRPMTDAEKSAWANQAALNLEQLIKEGSLEPVSRSEARGGESRQARQQPGSPQIPPARKAEDQGLGLAAAISEQDAEVPTKAEPVPQPRSEPAPFRTVAQQHSDPLADLAQKMAALLRQTLPNGNPVLSDAAALAPLESMRPGVLATIEQDDHPLAGLLLPSDLSVLREARRRVLASPNDAPPDLLAALKGASAAPSFTITRAALCTRVSGFGRYEPFPSQSFVAGRPVRAIVYTELDGFQSRAARPGDPVQQRMALSEQVSVEFSQSLSLYHDRDGLLAWHKPAQSVIETSRSARRDFYLIQIIDLPATLSVGRYNLKVRVVDATSGAEAESIVPLEVVADPGLVARPR